MTLADSDRERVKSSVESIWGGMKGGGSVPSDRSFPCGDEVRKGSWTIKEEKLFLTERSERYGEDLKQGGRDDEFGLEG